MRAAGRCIRGSPHVHRLGRRVARERALQPPAPAGRRRRALEGSARRGTRAAPSGTARKRAFARCPSAHTARATRRFATGKLVEERLLRSGFGRRDGWPSRRFYASQGASAGVQGGSLWFASRRRWRAAFELRLECGAGRASVSQKRDRRRSSRRGFLAPRARRRLIARRVCSRAVSFAAEVARRRLAQKSALRVLASSAAHERGPRCPRDPRREPGLSPLSNP